MVYATKEEKIPASGKVRRQGKKLKYPRIPDADNTMKLLIIMR